MICITSSADSLILHSEMNSLKPIIDSLNSLDHYDLFSEDSVAPDGALNSSEDDEDSDIEMDI